MRLPTLEDDPTPGGVSSLGRAKGHPLDVAEHCPVWIMNHSRVRAAVPMLVDRSGLGHQLFLHYLVAAVFATDARGVPPIRIAGGQKPPLPGGQIDLSETELTGGSPTAQSRSARLTW